MPLFGAQPATHIANGSLCVVLGRVVTSKSPKYVLEINGASTENLIAAGFTKINPGEFAKFSPPVGLFAGSWLHRDTVYVTVILLNSDGDFEIIAREHPFKDNTSVIITLNKDLRETNMGSIWTDIFGENHNLNKIQEEAEDLVSKYDAGYNNTTNISPKSRTAQKMVDITSANVEESLNSNKISGKKEETVDTNKTLIEEIEKSTHALNLNTKILFEEKFFQENCNKIKFPDDENIYEASIEKFNFNRTKNFLGRGKSSVFSAKHEETGKEVALKHIHILHTRHISNQDKEKIKAFIKELEIMKNVFECNNIVKIYGFYMADINAVLCMELMSCSLLELYTKIHELRNKFGTLSEDLLGEVVVNILDALIYCKQKYIIHRDIKPGNILVNKIGEIKLCDFGESRLLVNSVATTTVGTLVYFAPERFEQLEYDVRSDVWSLGITLAETAYGRIPYDGIDLRNSDPWPYFKKVVSAITKEELIKKSYGKKYSKDARDFLEACLEPFENRPKYDGLQEKEFYIRYKNTDFKPNIADLVKKMEELGKK